MNLAIVIAGEERGFFLARLWSGWAKFVLEPLQNVSSIATFLCLEPGPGGALGEAIRRAFPLIQSRLHVVALRRFFSVNVAQRRAECWRGTVLKFEATRRKRFSHVFVGRTDAVWFDYVQWPLLSTDRAVVLRARRLGGFRRSGPHVLKPAEHPQPLTEAHFSWWGWSSACPLRHCREQRSHANTSSWEHVSTHWCLLADDQAAVVPRRLADVFFLHGEANRRHADEDTAMESDGLRGEGGVRYSAWRDAACFGDEDSTSTAQGGGISASRVPAPSCRFFGEPRIRAQPGGEEYARLCTQARWKPAACWQEHRFTSSLLDANVPIQLGPLPFYLHARSGLQLGTTSDRAARVPSTTRRVRC